MDSQKLAALRKNPFAAGGLVVFVWLVGIAFMHLPLGDGLRRMGYDYLHTFARFPTPEDVLVIGLNEATDRKLNVPQNQSIKRSDHARLLDRLTKAGAALVCYDILFDQASADPVEDEKFSAAIRANKRVILGAVEELDRTDATVRILRVVGPVERLRKEAYDVGLLNTAPPDTDGVVRRFQTAAAQYSPLALAAARAVDTKISAELPNELWLLHTVRPGAMSNLEMADCLDPAVISDEQLRGKTVFIGGQYASNANGKPDLLHTPLSRFGAPPVYGVTWHATVFASLRGEKKDQRWFALAGLAQNAAWALPLALLSVLLLRLRSAWLCAGIWLLAAAGLSLAGVYAMWEQQVLLNWLVPGLVQLPVCFAAMGANLLVPRFWKPERIHIFLSACTDEFASYRSQLAAALHSEIFKPEHQGNLNPKGDATLEKLDAHIRNSDVVVHLVGNTAGADALSSSVDKLLEKYPDLARRLRETPVPVESRRMMITYTQWEAYLAILHRTRLVVAFADERTEQGPLVANQAQRDSQANHRERLRHLGGINDPIKFTNIDELTIALLHTLHEELRPS